MSEFFHNSSKITKKDITKKIGYNEIILTLTSKLKLSDAALANDYKNWKKFAE